ncbi:hypothetical protein [Pedobacter ureilyticus]|jgi:hypothetical protein|uniref:DUF4149 domain-containing protein n=1 Tax=Pedobacter ureilyticus TaxID=1393051 RepID=A0ABW9JAU7_9SPHI|nr:hypothetical protein [Pedobacter helvus]
MLIVNKPMAFIGLILVFVAGFCPMLEVKILVKWISWGLYKTDIRLFLITYSLIAITALCFFIRQLKAFRLLTRVMFIWVLLMAAAVYFKSTHYFGMKIADNLLGKAIHFQWGWIILLIGAILLLFSVKKEQLSA